MPRFGMMITDEIEAALKEENKTTGVPMSLIARKAMEEYLASKGYKFTTALEWGGSRREKPTDQGDK